MRKALFLLLVLLSASAVAQVAEGDQHWLTRAEGQQNGVASAAPIDAAIGAYQRAFAANPNDLEAAWKVMRAIRFKGAYVARSNDDKKKIYDQGRAVGEKAMKILDRLLAAKGITSVSKASEKQIADAARSIPNAGEVYYWDAANWGEWAIAFGKLAAVRQGAADRIKRDSTIAMLIDPKLEQGGGARILGRLHNQTPRVPFLTGWASDELAVKYLNQALAMDPANKLTKVFLAEAMVANDSNTKPQATQMLRDVISSPNDPNFLVENSASQNDARALLKKWGS